MSARTFYTRLGCALEMGTFHLGFAGWSLVGSQAFVRFGKAGAPSLILDSANPPGGASVFTWDGSDLRVLVADSTPLGPGKTTYQISVLSNGLLILGEEGTVQVAEAI